ncbi:MAG: glycosyltransferase family 4 protein, partial [Gammaproteobacteria bacterium]
LAAARAADGVLVLRKTFGPLATWLLRRAAKKLLFDFDDAIFVASNGQPSTTRNRRFVRMVRCCDQVWAGNRFLQQQAAGWNSDVKLVPTVVDEQKYRLADHEADDSVDLVWIGSRSTRKYLQTLVPLLNGLGQQNGRIRLKVVADFELEGLTLPQLRVDWSEAAETQALASAHIGLAPLIDNDWTRGKCGLKVLQYMAAGLPVVTDEVGVNQSMVTHGETGYVVNSEAEWTQALLSLAGDASQRRRMGLAGRRKLIDDGYTLTHNAQRLPELLDGVTGLDAIEK